VFLALLIQEVVPVETLRNLAEVDEQTVLLNEGGKRMLSFPIAMGFAVVFQVFRGKSSQTWCSLRKASNS
jgi:hypothetical protein